MKLEARKYLHDIERAAMLIEEFVAGKDPADYAEDAMLRQVSAPEMLHLAERGREAVSRAAITRRW